MKNSILGVPSTAQPNGGAESGAPEKYPEPRSGPEARGRRVATFWGMNWIALTAEGVDVRRDEQGVPVEWTLLRIGDNPICQEGEDGNINLSPGQMGAIVDYFEKKGEEIPIDSEHYLYELANKNKIDESEALRMFPGGVAALGYGRLKLVGNALRIRVRWTPTAYKFLKEKIYKYFSPSLRGLESGQALSLPR